MSNMAKTISWYEGESQAVAIEIQERLIAYKEAHPDQPLLLAGPEFVSLVEMALNSYLNVGTSLRA